MRVIKKAALLTWLLGCVISTVQAQVNKVAYIRSTADFPNPERGFYLAVGQPPGTLSAVELKKLRTVYAKRGSASYQTWISLIYRGYLLTDFRKGALSGEFLEKLQGDFDAVRQAGLKMVLRFSYIDKTTKGGCPDGEICPPYGDASKDIVLQHIAQLKPLLMKNADVISVFQQGFIGIWGENHYTDYFGDPSKNGTGFIPDQGWNDRNDVLKALLDALPKDRMVQVRTPQLKQRFVFGAGAPLTTKATDGSAAYTFTDASRVALHNDCFLASKDDYGTFSDYGNKEGRAADPNDLLRKYFIAESKYLAVGGETCDDSFSPQNDCAPLGYAIKEMAAMHYSFLNVSYNNLVNNDWETQGCMAEIKRNLGYRFVLKSSSVTKRIAKGKKLQFSLELQNEGYATPYNPRPVQLVFRERTSKKVYKQTLKTNIQKWYSGKVLLNEAVALPVGIPKGSYELLLAMPDAAASLKNRPEYSLRLANERIWEESTGFNKLAQVITIL
ncbi:DUF4832 domain-containing protein [Pedobacter psychroterrae]|uniref:DUF4832 domain-containing protein n=1 Tax=Pedobacter psychroterrae TaxID=2530453 RepID=A0A4R0NKU2_9SPHI|nr:DUF4832 domain-containing protein [Pedobacter psychroterrae]TCD00508.1 DUF4832 domain-containing protein [Pedobacter psychroterrae]